MKFRRRILLLLPLLGICMQIWGAAIDTLEVSSVLGISRPSEIISIECTSDKEFAVFREGRLKLTNTAQIAAFYNHISNLSLQRKLILPEDAQTDGIRVVFTRKDGHKVEYREGIGFLVGTERGRIIVYRELKHGDYQMDAALHKLRDRALIDENKAFLNLFPPQKRFGEATQLSYLIDQIDSVKIANGNTGQYTILTNRKDIRALYDALYDLPLTRALYEPSTGYGYALYFRKNSRGMASFAQSAYGTLAQPIQGGLAVVYRLEDADAQVKFKKAVQPYFIAGMLRDNQTMSRWAAGEILRAGTRGLITDRLAGESMQQAISRWKFAEMLVQILQLRPPEMQPKPIEACPYDGYTAEVTAWRYGLLIGRDGGFASNDMLTRQECAVLLSRVLTLYGIENTVTPAFTDAEQAAPWAQTALKHCGKILLGDTNGKFRPNDPIRIEEAILAVNRLYQRILQYK